MRPIIVQYLNDFFRTNLFNWIVPDRAVVYSAAIFVCSLIFIRRVRQSSLSEYHAWGVVIFGALAGLIGVRLWYLLMHLGSVVRDPAMLLDFNGATVSFGGYSFGSAAFIGYLMLRGQKPLGYLDAAASCLGLGPMIARWACFLNGDDYGTLTSVPWAVVYPPGSYVFVDQVNKHLINLMADHSLPVHPVQLYLSLKGLVLFLICSWLWRKKKLRPGILFGMFWIFYSFLRFFIEFTRGDAPPIWNSFTYGQIVCVIILICSITFVLTLRRIGLPKTAATGGLRGVQSS